MNHPSRRGDLFQLICNGEMKIFCRTKLVFDLVNWFTGQFCREVTKLIDVMKWRGAKKKQPIRRNSIQEFANFRNAAILRFIDDGNRESLFLLLRVSDKRSQLFNRDKSNSGVIQTEPVQIARESRNEVGSRRHQRRLPGLERDRFRGQDRLKGFPCPGSVMDEKRGSPLGILRSFRINQAIQGQIDAVADRRILAGAQALQQPPFVFCRRGDGRKIVFLPIWKRGRPPESR